MTKMTQCLSHQASTSSDEHRAIILADDSFSSSTQPEDSIEFIAEVTGSNPGVFYLLDLVLFNACFNYLLTWGYKSFDTELRRMRLSTSRSRW